MKEWNVLFPPFPAGAAGCTMEEILVLKSEQYKGDGSPTRRLLWQLGCQSYKVHDLFEKLKESKRIYEMDILKEYGTYDICWGTKKKNVCAIL